MSARGFLLGDDAGDRVEILLADREIASAALNDRRPGCVEPERARVGAG